MTETARVLCELTASAALAHLRRGELSAEKYMSALLMRCEGLASLNAFIGLDPPAALEAACRVDRQRAATRGDLWERQPLLGLPLVIKDNIDIAGMVTTAGTPALAARLATRSAPVAAALLRAGGLLLGKTNMHELAFGITSNNAAFGAVRNPYAPELIAGGSSGGTAAALAARLAPAGLGTDTGGSVRIPAALCGIAGLRPTTGRYSGQGIVPISHSRDTAGPMTRSVTDLALLDAVLCGVMPPAPLPGAAKLAGLRLGVPREYFFEGLDAAIIAPVEAALARLRDAGCILVEADIPGLEALNQISAGIANYEFCDDLASYLAECAESPSVAVVIAGIASPDVREIMARDIAGNARPTVAWYRQAVGPGRAALQRAYREYFRQHGLAAMVFPTTRLPARPIGEDRDVLCNGVRVPTFAAYLRNTAPSSTAGVPGLALPVGQTAMGLPVGLEFDAPAGADAALLGIGLAVEGLFGRLPCP